MQNEIVARSTSREAGQAALEAHRERRDRVAATFVAAYAAVAAASVDLNAASLERAALAAAAAVRALGELGFLPPKPGGAA
jgi:hypothetical protein